MPTPTSASERHDRDHDRLAWKVGRIQEPERGAAVPHVREVEQPGHERDALVQADAVHDQHLRHLVEHDDAADQQPFGKAGAGPGGVRSVHGSTGTASASTQRSHSPSRPAAAEIDGTIPPAALTLRPGRPLHAHGQRPAHRRGVGDGHFRDDEQRRQRVLVAAQQRQVVAATRSTCTRAIERVAESPFLCRCSSMATFTASRMREQPLPVRLTCRIRAADRAPRRAGNSARWTDSSRALAAERPSTTARPSPAGWARSAAPARRQRGTSPSAPIGGSATRRQRVQAVLRHVHVERAEIHGRERVQRRARRSANSIVVVGRDDAPGERPRSAPSA